MRMLALVRVRYLFRHVACGWVCVQAEYVLLNTIRCEDISPEVRPWLASLSLLSSNFPDKLCNKPLCGDSPIFLHRLPLNNIQNCALLLMLLQKRPQQLGRG